MMSRRYETLVRLLLLLAVAAGAGQSWRALAAQRSGGAAQDPQLAALQARIADLQTELERIGRDRNDVVREFETADVQLTLRKQQLAVLERRGQLLEQERRRQVAVAEQRSRQLSQARRLLSARAVALYRIGPLSYARLLLSAARTDNILVGYQLVTYLAARDHDLAARVEQDLAQLRQAVVALGSTERQLRQVTDDTRAATETLQAEQDRRRSALRKLDREAEAQRESLAAANRAARRLENTIGDLASAAEPAPSADTFATARGQLPWPVEGAVIGAFGPRRHPVYDTVTVSRGIEIEAARGDPIAAVFAGRVAFADWYSGYGLLVILDHGGGFFTLYGHLEATEVKVNAPVDAGQTIGRAGDTGSLSGPNLYFEVREGTDALNPLQWLRRRAEQRP